MAALTTQESRVATWSVTTLGTSVSIGHYGNVVTVEVVVVELGQNQSTR